MNTSVVAWGGCLLSPDWYLPRRCCGCGTCPPLWGRASIPLAPGCGRKRKKGDQAALRSALPGHAPVHRPPRDFKGTKDQSLRFPLPDPFFLSISYAPSRCWDPSLNIFSSKTVLSKVGTSSITVHCCPLFLSAMGLALLSSASVYLETPFPQVNRVCYPKCLIYKSMLP